LACAPKNRRAAAAEAAGAAAGCMVAVGNAARGRDIDDPAAAALRCTSVEKARLAMVRRETDEEQTEGTNNETEQNERPPFANKGWAVSRSERRTKKK